MQRFSRGKRPEFYDHKPLDQLMSMVMVLASDCSALADEVDLMKRVIKTHGINLAEEMERFTLDETALEEREVRRQRSLERLFYAVTKEVAELQTGDTSEQYQTTLDTIAQQ